MLKNYQTTFVSFLVICFVFNSSQADGADIKIYFRTKYNSVIDCKIQSDATYGDLKNIIVDEIWIGYKDLIGAHFDREFLIFTKDNLGKAIKKSHLDCLMQEEGCFFVINDKPPKYPALPPSPIICE